MRTLPVLLSAIPLALVLPHALNGQSESASFTISQLGKQVGTASFNIVSTNGGYDSTSKVHVSMRGLEYAFSKTEQQSTAHELRYAHLSATVNGSAVTVVGVPDGSQFLLNISASGRKSSARVAAHTGTVFMPDFDPGALETLLELGISRNSHDLWAIFPKQSGDQPATIDPIQLVTYPDEQGTLDGQTVTVHHLVANIAGTSTDLFSGPENQLLQAELQQQGFALIRNGFVLKPPSKAGAAPPLEE